MDVRDVLTLREWVENSISPILSDYQALPSVISHNASQPQAQPVAEPLENLIKQLKKVKTEELSLLQMRVLEHLGVAQLIGRRGVHWVRKTIQSANYDPATASDQIAQANYKLSNLKGQLNEFSTAANVLGFELSDVELEEIWFRVSIVFQNETELRHVPDLKKSAADWDLIISGVAECAGEQSANSHIVGVANGSILVTLATTAMVTKLLAIVVKHASEIASYAIGIMTQIEDLRSKKMSNKIIEKQLQDMEKASREAAEERVVEEVKAQLPQEIAPEQENKLKAAIKKLLDFKEKGGDVDFATPPTEIVDDEDFDEEAAQLINEVTAAIEDAQRARQDVKLLEDKQNDQEEED